MPMKINDIFVMYAIFMTGDSVLHYVYYDNQQIIFHFDKTRSLYDFKTKLAISATPILCLA